MSARVSWGKTKGINMPFRSEKQRKFMWSQHPEIAKRWTDKYGSKVVPSKKIKKKPKTWNPYKAKYV